MEKHPDHSVAPQLYLVTTQKPQGRWGNLQGGAMQWPLQSQGSRPTRALTEKAALSNMGTGAAHGLRLSYIREGLLLLPVKCYCQFNMKILSSKKPSHTYPMPSCPKTWSFGSRKRSHRDILEDSCWDAGVNFVMRDPWVSSDSVQRHACRFAVSKARKSVLEGIFWAISIRQ